MDLLMLTHVRRAIFGIVAALLLAVSVGCAGLPATAPATAAQTSADVHLAWPAWPEPPRIRYLHSVASPADWGIARSWWQRLTDALTGGNEMRFAQPSAVAEHNGVLYVADPDAQSLWVLDRPAGQARRLMQLGTDFLVAPVALALRSDGAVFVADTALRKVFLVDKTGQLLRSFATQGLERPAALVWDERAHRLFVLDSVRHRITVFDGNGTLLRHMGENGNKDGQFNRPTHMTQDRDGSLLINDAMNFRLQWLSQDGKFLGKFGKTGNGSGDFAASKGVATDGDGHYYVVDSLFDTVQIFDRQGRLLLNFGEHGSEPGQFALPRGLFISADDTIYVADAYNHRIQVFQGALATRAKESKP